MVWTDVVQGAARSSGWSLSKRCNAAMRRPDHLPAGFAPESTLDSVVLLANMQAIRRVARLASANSGANAYPPINEMSSHG
ncbi:MAG: hypothetical protein ACXWJK_11060 [Burkholderiaceae bacterium]